MKKPELFPGLIYRMMKPKIVLLIFVSGKIVLTGAKVREEMMSDRRTDSAEELPKASAVMLCLMCAQARVRM